MTLVAQILMVLGAVLQLIGAVGLLRLPGFYARSHAATKPDTLGLVLLLTGLALYGGLELTSAKTLVIVLFVFLANPASSHALGRAAIRNGFIPWTVKESEERS